jgi:hypothetical protein
MLSHKLSLILITFICAFLLVSCSSDPLPVQADVEESKAQLLVTAAVEEPEATPSPPTETPIPPTNTAVQPTEPAPTPTPEITEFVASSLEDIAGSWWATYISDKLVTEFNTDGTWVQYYHQDPSRKGRGKIRFEGTTVYLVNANQACPSSEATYQAHVIQADGQNFKLYFTPIDDTCKERVRDYAKHLLWGIP